jgi:fatty-acyl-CoA synthase
MLSFVARADDTIIVAGLNVYPQEVEDVVLAMPDIKDAVVFKIEDPYAGQRIFLQYCADSAIDPALVRQWCRDQLAPYQLPQQLLQVKQIERLANGKVNRKQLAMDFETERTALNSAAIEV